MAKIAAFSLLIAVWALSAGCATIVTEKANLDAKPNGIRVYPPKVCLMVDHEQKKSTLAYLPDYNRAYDVKPLTIFAKQEFRIEIEEGQAKALTANQETTAFLSFFKEAATLAAKAAGVAVSASTIDGSFGLGSGIYCLGDDGMFRRMRID